MDLERQVRFRPDSDLVSSKLSSCYRVSQIHVEQGQTVELAISSPPSRQISLAFPLTPPSDSKAWP